MRTQTVWRNEEAQVITPGMTNEKKRKEKKMEEEEVKKENA